MILVACVYEKTSVPPTALDVNRHGISCHLALFGENYFEVTPWYFVSVSFSGTGLPGEHRQHPHRHAQQLQHESNRWPGEQWHHHQHARGGERPRFDPNDDLEAIADAEARAQVAEAKAEADAAAAAAAAAAAVKEEEEEQARAAQNDPTVVAVVSGACVTPAHTPRVLHFLFERTLVSCLP